jgi:hypothetical protein
VSELLESAREHARSVLADHHAILDAVADEFTAHETVSGICLAVIASAESDGTVLVAGTAAPNGTAAAASVLAA